MVKWRNTPDQPSSQQRPLRVLHCVHNVGGNAAALARAERELGLQSVAVTLRQQGNFEFAIDEVLCSPHDSHLVAELRRWRLLVRAVREFDVVHFNFGRSIAPPYLGRGAAARHGWSGPAAVLADMYMRAAFHADLPILRAAGKSLFITYQGDDARQGDWTLANFEICATPFVEPGYYSPQSDQAKRLSITKVQRYVSGIFAVNPDLLHVLPRGARFMPVANVDPRAWAPAPRHPGRPVIMHAPTHRGVKGTPEVIRAVRELQDEGIDLEFVLVEGCTHEQARQMYRRADLLIDQLYVGWYGTLAVELMALSRPVMCYLREEDLVYLPASMSEEIPVINVTARTLKDRLRRWLTTEVGDDRGVQSRAYVERWHDPVRIASDLATAYARAVSAPNRHGRIG